MLKIKDNVDLKELEKFGYKMIPEGLYAKSLKRDVPYMPYTNAIIREVFVTVEKDRKLKKYVVYSYRFHMVFEQKEKHLFRFNIKDLIKADLVEKVKGA